MWEFLNSLVKAMMEATKSADITLRLAFLMGLMIILLWVIGKIV
jgi:hypothetical protein